MKGFRNKKGVQEIRIDDQVCKGCFLCLEVCPNKVLTTGEKRSRGGYPMPRVADLAKCTGCFLCEITCPDLALTVVKEKK
jgi:2-oxoglutarate ferredoxin oxidoreductase subunit delta